MEDNNWDAKKGEAPAADISEVNLFDKYEVGKLLGRGASAKVYHARNVCTGQSVAIKAMSKNKVIKEGLAVHIKREISIMRRLHHPHVVRLFEVLATKTKIYFVMEFAKGGEIFAKILKGRFSEDLSRRYFQQLIAAIGYCHSRGVFHRDLKPENLLLDENWDLKISDFGLSSIKDQNRPDDLLHTLCGTPAYVAPEILAKKGYDGAKVDVWSCGVILFVLNAGYLPFNDSNLMVIYRKIYKGDFRCPKWTSPDLKRLLFRLLDTNPSTRITIDEILHDPWFKKGYKAIQFQTEDFGSKLHGEDGSSKNLNAFDLISFSSGFDLSGLFRESFDTPVCEERFVSAASPERILGRVKEVSKGENVKLVTKDWGAKLVGHSGNLVVGVEIHRLTDKLVMVEIQKRERDGVSQEIWKDKLLPKLRALIYQPEATVAGN